MTRPLSVGIVCFPSIGGSGVVASEQARALADRGHRVHLVSGAQPLRPQAVCENLTFHEVVVPEYPLFEHAPYSLALATKLVELSRQHRLDIIHVHYAVPHATSAYLARQILGAGAPRCITSLHGTDVTRVGADPAYREVTAFSVAASDCITVPSESLRQEAFEFLKLPTHTKIDVVQNFVDTDRFSPATTRDPTRFNRLFPDTPPGPVLFHVSTFRAVKRTGDLLEVLARVRRTLPARLVLVGDGPERAALEEKTQALGLTEQVRFLGRRNDFIDDLRHADAFLLPSESESFGVAALEALSAGVPVFGYRVGGLPEVVSDDVGHLVEPFDINALADAVVSVVSDPKSVIAFGGRARERVLSHFQQGPAIDRYERYLQRILTKEKR